MNEFLEIFEEENYIYVCNYEELYKKLIKDHKQFCNVIMKDKYIALAFPNLKDISSIYCEKDKIIINQKILKKISIYLTKDYYSRSRTFKDITEDFREISFLMIQEFMIKFIIFHELSHIELGHLETNYNNDFMEFDADKKAINILAGMYLKIIDKMGANEYKYLIGKLITSLMHLFHFLINSRDDSRSYYIHARVILITSAFLETKYIINDIINLPLDEIIEIKDDCIIEFVYNFHKELKITTSKILKTAKIVDEYLEYRKTRV